ncbi:MAG: HNH endonuclease family protein, partial [Bacteroidales bacterium]|nr:HNH endonuclease family protein [Bacteroidales bacterium]
MLKVMIMHTLRTLSTLGGSAFRQHLILLLTARNLQADMFNFLAKNLETYLFYYLFTREQAKIYEKQFGKWNLSLQKVQSMTDLVNFVQTEMRPEITKKNAEFKARFLSFAEGDLQQYRVRYILAKLSMYIDQLRINALKPCSIESYIKNYEIEHILPQTPQPELLEYYNQLGTNYEQLRS